MSRMSNDRMNDAERVTAVSNRAEKRDVDLLKVMELVETEQ